MSVYNIILIEGNYKIGREIATPSEARKIMGLTSCGNKKNKYSL
ncbi:MAG: hypothetical protein QXM27_03065 [Candidatus Pacearchaeota archaeon]